MINVQKIPPKRDLIIKESNTNRELVGECLIWNGIVYYEEKKDQLFNRYLTWHDKNALLITFIRNTNFIDFLKKVKKKIELIPDTMDGTFQDLSGGTYKIFVSEHKHKSGTKIRLYHLFFHLPK